MPFYFGFLFIWSCFYCYATWLNKKIEDSFQAGCDTLMAACTAYGVTPESNSPDDIATAIGEIYSAGIRVFKGSSGNISSVIPNYASLTSANFKVIASSLSCSVGTTQAVSGMRGSSTPSVSYNASTGAWSVGGNSCGWNATSICNLSASMGVYGVVVNPDATF